MGVRHWVCCIYEKGQLLVGASGDTLGEAVCRAALALARAWTTPILRERDVCENCDGAPDGGHSDDALCVRTLEEFI